jgi:Tol biopolymer transport system component
MTKDGYWRILTAAVVAALTYGCGGQQAVDHGGSLLSEEGRIAFMRATSFDGPDIESDVYTINVDGSGETRLTDTPGLNGFPSWSPDGEKITFASDRDGGNWELYVMDADASEQRRLTNTPEDESVSAWSPDGEKIAYAIDVIENPSIHVMNADGSNRRRLADGNWPTWSPDGQKIAYTMYSGEVPYLAVMNADGSGQRSLGASVVQRMLGIRGAEEPAWAPQGEKIAFASYAGRNNSEIYVMNADGTGRTRLTDIPGHDHWPPTWSPDGERIAFTSDGAKGIGEIYVMNSDGSGLTKLTDDPAEDSFPAWRP